MEAVRAHLGDFLVWCFSLGTELRDVEGAQVLGASDEVTLTVGGAQHFSLGTEILGGSGSVGV